MFGLRLGRKRVKKLNTVLRGLRCYLRLLLLGGALVAATPARADLPLRSELPVPCTTGCSAMGGPNGWISSGQATLSSGGSTLYVNQQSDKAILNWQSFNISADNQVRFNQPDAGSVALNRIYDADPSRINGALSANGQLFLINRNGMLFGPNARVDVNSLTASTLNVTDETFNVTGIIEAVKQGQAAFVAEGPMGSVVIESGAELRSADGGRIMVLAPVIENHGRIETPEGQTILAASQDKVWLKAASKDDNLRGLLVEVGTGGDVSNLGEIVARRGNITLMGFAVNQEGLLSATTAVTSNGSIKLIALNQTTTNPETSAVQVESISTERDGEAARVTFGTASRTEVLPELEDETTAVDEQKQPSSSVEVMARDILLRQGAEIVAPGGDVTLMATANPLLAAQVGTVRNDSRVVLEQGSLIDVSGTTSTLLAMERNELEIELRGNELKDSPLQRDSVLRGKKVIIDIREGTPITDISAALAKIERDVGERLSAGGTVTVASEGDVVMASGATVDISGGKVEYEAGWINTTKLTSEGKVYDIGAADPNRIYDGVLGEYIRKDPKWGQSQSWRIAGPVAQGRYEQGYVEGQDAGDFKVTASAVRLEGDVVAHVTQGARQDDLPQLGGLELDLARLGKSGVDYPAAGVIFTAATATHQGEDTLDPSANITIDPRLLQEGGVGRLTVRSNGEVTVPEGTELRLAAGGELRLSGGAIGVAGTIVVPAGTVVLNTEQTRGVVNRPLNVGEQGVIDVSGLWSNDYESRDGVAAGRSEAWHLDGGSVTLDAKGDLTLAAGSRIAADGGGAVDAQGRLHGGDGGKINLTSRVQLPEGSEMVLAGDLHAYALGEGDGGSLSIEANGLRIAAGGKDAAPGELLLAPEFFQQGGFNKYSLTSNLDGITVAAGTVIKPQAQRVMVEGDFASRVSGEDLSSFSHLALLPDGERSPVDLSLTLDQKAAATVTPAHFDIETGARIEGEPGARVALTSGQSINVDGVISTPGGQIELKIVKPGGATDPYYLPEQGIRIGSAAQLLAVGTAVLLPNRLGQPVGEVLDGGQVSLTADRGHIVAEAGSLIDVSGTVATVQIRPQGAIGGGALEQVASDAGAIHLTAAEGMVLAGDLAGRAGAAHAAGGELHVALDATNREEDVDKVPSAPYRDFGYTARTLTLGSGAGDAQLLTGQARVDGEAVEEGGFDSLTLRVAELAGNRGQINLDHANLDLRRSIELDAAVLNNTGGDSHLGAAHVALNDSSAKGVVQPAAVSGEGRLEIEAQQLDLIGNVTLQGWQQARLASEGDMRLIGLRPGSSSKEWLGSLNSFADLELQAARIFPATLTQYQIEVSRPDGALNILAAPQPASGPLLAAGGKLTLTADNITQAGVVQAPFGEINLVADKNLVLAAGSLTSTSAEGQVIPFGQTQLGLDWIYQVDASNTLIFSAPPAQNINLQAPSVRQESGAVIDVSGGGDLAAYEFVPGPGGSRDVLAAENSVNTFAIIPTMQGYGPHDPQAFTGTTLKAGDTVHLAAGSGLPAGDYLLLPARYALLPGAYLVTAEPGTQDFGPGQAVIKTDGSVIVAGYRTVADTGIRESRWSGYAVAPGSIARSRSEYQESLASEFFSQRAAAADQAAPLLPQDAGHLVINVTRELQLEGELRALSEKGRGARVDLEAENLAIVAERGAADGTVQVTAGSLTALGAESLLLGGHRSESGGKTSLAVSAKRVTVKSGTQVTVPELLLAASEEVKVEAGAALAASGEVAASGVSYALNGDGALLQLSAGAPVAVERSGGNGEKGDLRIEAGATLTAAGSMYLESSRDTVMSGALEMEGGSLTLGAKQISLGDAPAATSGLVLTQAQLDGLHMDHLTLASRETVDIHGGVGLDMKGLTIAAAGVVGHGDATATINADTLELKNVAGSTAAGAVADSAQLRVTTNELRQGEGTFKLDGFSTTELSATQQVKIAGEGTLNVDGDLTLRTPLITAERGADSTIAATGKLQALALPNETTVTTAATAGLGARLALTGSDVTLGTTIQLPSGEVTLKADEGDVHLLAGAAINVSGRIEKFADVTVATPAGNVTLQSNGGDVVVDEGAAVALRSVAGGGAGVLKVSAASGELILNGTLDARDENGNGQGTVKLDLGTVADFSQLNRDLNESGFGGGRELRLRHGNIDIALADTVQAERVQMTADDGAINLRGRINAAAARGGEVILQAKDDLHLHSTARIDARATGEDEPGGRVVLATTAGAIAIDAADDAAAAVIDVSGTRVNGDAALQHVGGKVELRAPRVGEGVAVTSLAGRIKGAESISVEAFRTYESTVINASLQQQVNADTAAYMANAADITAALHMSDDPRFHLRPGVEIDSRGNLVVTDTWDLAERDDEGNQRWRYGDESGVLTLRAAKELVFMESVRDGLETGNVQIYPDDPYSGMPVTGRLLAGDSWSFRFAGGADLSSADPLAVNGGEGKVTLAGGVQLHSGSGDIDLVSGGDLNFGDESAAIFSAGRSGGYGSLSMEWMAYVYPGVYPVRGGDVTLDVAGDINGKGSKQLISDWLHRMGNFGRDGGAVPTAWAVNFKDADDQAMFKQTLGAFGGGRLTVHADGDIDRLSAVVPTTGRPDGEYSGSFDNGFTSNEVTVLGSGGALDISAGGNINGGIFYVDGGIGKISAGKSIQADESGVAAIVALGDGKVTLQSHDDLTVETVLNPSVLPASAQQVERDLAESLFFRYGEESGVALNSLAGDVTLRNGNGALKDGDKFPNISNYFANDGLFALTRIYPGDLRVAALKGDIYIDNSFTLFPSRKGNLSLLADGDITMHGSNSVAINMSDADPAFLPDSSRPVDAGRLNETLSRLNITGAAAHAAVPVHAGDTEPVEIVARHGSLRGSADGRYALAFYLPKHAHLVAGEDIRNIIFSGQNISPEDVTTLQAGRDIAYSNQRNDRGQLAPSNSELTLSGPGELVLRAGRTVDLGTFRGVTTIGNTSNVALDEAGASITIEAGMKSEPDFNAYLNHYAPLDAELSAALVEAVRTKSGQAQMSESDALAAVAQLSQAQQRQLALPHFYAELAKASRLAAQSQNGADYQGGYDAITTLFGEASYQGDLRLYFSRIHTIDGGDISLLVPGGLINAGLAATGGDFQKEPSELGIVAQRSGSVNIYLDKDMMVNQSRVFALDGGDIMIWSQNGNIDAGRGAKSALAVPSPTVTFDQNGTMTVEFPAAIAGSGIRNAAASPGVKPGSVTLAAPKGVVIANDAGIESGGDIVIPGDVSGRENISAGGSKVGDLSIEPPAISTDVANAGNSSSNANGGQELAGLTPSTTPISDAALAFLEVEVLGFGDGKNSDKAKDEEEEKEKEKEKGKE